MDEKEVRLTGCFLAVFPEISAREITKASSNSVQNWDSMASVALLTEVEEEFGIIIEGDDLARFNSFKGFLSYLQETENERQVDGASDAV
jgi:acyl carrier protein